jgi:hypothetical protein
MGAFVTKNGLINNGMLNQKIVLDSTGITLPRSVVVVKQTVAGITTSLWAAPEVGDTVNIRNAGGGSTTTVDGNGINIEDAPTFTLNNGESIMVIYDGTQWTVF